MGREDLTAKPNAEQATEDPSTLTAPAPAEEQHTPDPFQALNQTEFEASGFRRDYSKHFERLEAILSSVNKDTFATLDGKTDVLEFINGIEMREDNTLQKLSEQLVRIYKINTDTDFRKAILAALVRIRATDEETLDFLDKAKEETHYNKMAQAIELTLDVLQDQRAPADQKNS
jgi:PBP1b-binding outer membrane lipoprotein LpoB